MEKRRGGDRETYRERPRGIERGRDGGEREGRLGWREEGEGDEEKGRGR